MCCGDRWQCLVLGGKRKWPAWRGQRCRADEQSNGRVFGSRSESGRPQYYSAVIAVRHCTAQQNRLILLFPFQISLPVRDLNS